MVGAAVVGDPVGEEVVGEADTAAIAYRTHINLIQVITPTCADGLGSIINGLTGDKV